MMTASKRNQKPPNKLLGQLRRWLALFVGLVVLIAILTAIVGGSSIIPTNLVLYLILAYLVFALFTVLGPKDMVYTIGSVAALLAVCFLLCTGLYLLNNSSNNNGQSANAAENPTAVVTTDTPVTDTSATPAP